MKIKDMTPIFQSIAEYIAKCEADEVEAKGALLMSKDAYIQQKSAVYFAELDKENKQLVEYLERGDKILSESGSLFPDGSDKDRYQEFLLAMNKLNEDTGENKLPPLESWLEFLGLSHETMFWVYQIGHQLLEQKNYKDAAAIFFTLSMLYPFACDHWLGFGFAQQGSLDPRALASFTQASSLDPDNPMPRYQKAKIHLEQKQFDQALVELNRLMEIAEDKKLDSLKPELVKLIEQAKCEQ
jgi:tetratricopeptide (TPR) repeat protein